MLDATALELEVEVQVLDSIIQANEFHAEFAQAMIDRTDPSLPPLSDDSLALFAAGHSDFEIYDPGFGALSALISTGGLEQVRDPGLQRRLAGWPAELDDLDWERDQVAIAMDRLNARATETGLWLEVGDDPLVVTAARGIRDDPTVRRIWGEIIFMFAFYDADLRRVRTRAAELAADLRAR
jgi:hypothetical protein